jgi:hypothetical protein
MANAKTFTRSFSGGQVSPAMYGRLDDITFQTGAALLSNFIATPQGPAQNRAGFAYVLATKNNGVARLIPFIYSSTQTMVLELGNQYIRFHTMGETLVYATAGVRAWVPPSNAITLSYTTPTTVTWAGHGLSTGDPVRFFMVGGHAASELPAGLQVGYTYTVQVLDANSFNILDNGVAVALAASGGGGTGSSTNYVGTGTTTAQVFVAPSYAASSTSAPLGGLASTAIAGGLATINVSLSSAIQGGASGGTGGGGGTGGTGGSGGTGGGGGRDPQPVGYAEPAGADGDAASSQASGSSAASITYEYNAGNGWVPFYASGATESQTVQVQIALADLDQLQLQIVVFAEASSSASVGATGTITSWSVDVPTSSTASALAIVQAYRYYTAGDVVSYAGNSYTSIAVDSGGTTTPGTSASIWALLPADLTYEIPSPYLAADLFDIHYAQSADVMTLVHPNYPPMELRRLSATSWTLTAIDFGADVATPTNLAVTASPGYLAKISTISTANPALITTVASHTLALGDPIYLNGIVTVVGGVNTTLSGFYLVSNVPTDSDGNLIPNQLEVMDYSGNTLDSTGWTSYTLQPGTIQYGTKVFDLNSYYAVSALDATGANQSALTGQVAALNDLDVPGSYNVLTWTAVAGVTNYYVFKQKNGLWGFIGQAAGTTFTDNNIAPDFSIGPTNLDNPFVGQNNYPAAVGYIEQRRCFAGTNDSPQTLWMTNSGTDSALSYSLPSEDTDRVEVKVAAREVSSILHIVPLQQLLLLTGSCEYAEYTANGGPITPSSIGIRPQSYIGASGVQPTIVNNSLVYCAARGGHVREMGYNWQANGFITGDMSLRAANLFDSLSIVDQAYAKAPQPIIWFVSSSGALLGLTYVPEEQIGAWHQHSTQGAFESIAVVSEGSEDRLYAVINRTVNGQTVRYVERMASRIVTDLPSCFFVDAGATYSSEAAVTTISGLTWLEGCTVAVLADGAVQTQKIVTGGAITLDTAASVVQVGLPYIADLQTLPMSLQVDGFGQGRQKNLNKVWIRLYQSSGVFTGPDETTLREYKQRTTEPYGSPPDLQTGNAEIVLTPSWNDQGQLLIRQTNPLPLTVVDCTLEVSIGG